MQTDLAWGDLKTILAIGRAGTLAGGARALKVSHSTMFRRLEQIEEKTNVRFFERLPHGYEPTEAGRLVIDAAERIDLEVAELDRKILGSDTDLHGSVRLTAPEGITTFLLGPILAQFQKEHPGIRLELTVTSRLAELSRRDADVAIRVTKNPPEAAFGRKVCQLFSAAYASKRLAAKHSGCGLSEYPWIVFDVETNWSPAVLWKGHSMTDCEIALKTNGFQALVNAAKAGIGAAIIPCFIGDSVKQLVRLQPPPNALLRDLWIIAHSDLRNTQRVRSLMKFLGNALANQPELRGDTSSPAARTRGPRVQS